MTRTRRGVTKTRRHTTRTRREFLRTATGASALGAASGATAATAVAQEGGQTVVDMTDQLVFAPEEITIAPGETVVWENVGNIGHSVTAYEDEIPEEAEYFASGGFDSEDAARGAYTPGDAESGDIAGGETYEHTFEVEGTYNYFCIPHEAVGMVGSIEVTEGGGGDGENGGGASGPPVPQVPEIAKTIAVGISVAFLSILALTYMFMKYGGDYEGGGGSDESAG